MSLFNELKRRNVFRVAAAYVIVGWLLLQVSDTLAPALHLPDWIHSGVAFLLILGFPVALVLAWAFELTPEGLKKETEVDRSESTAPGAGRKLDITIIGLLVLLLAFIAWDRLIFDPRRDAAPADAGEPSAIDQATAEKAAAEPAAAAPQNGEAALDDRPAIAVLPFENLSSDPEQAFFADGLAEDLIARLSSWRAFPVIARNSSFQYRGGNVDIKQVSEALGVRYIVEGSVRRAGDRIRVSAQLIDATSGENLWVDSYDSEVADVFTLQDDISAMIAAPLVSDLNRAEAKRARLRGTGNLEAWSLYQLGLQHADRHTREGLAAARELFGQAAERDPQFATALAQLAIAKLWEVVLGWDETPGETIAATLELARRADSLDPRDPATQTALGWAYVMAGDLTNGLHATRRAVELNPSMPQAWGWLSWALLLAGDTEGCIAAAKRTRRLNPRGGYSAIVYDNLSQCYWQEGRYEEGLEAANRLLAELPDYFLGHVFVAMNAVPLGRLDQARAAIAEGRREQPDLSLELVQGMYGVARPEIDARRNALLRQAGLE